MEYPANPLYRRPLDDAAPSRDHYRARYHMLLDAIPSSVLVFDPQLRIVAANTNFLKKSRVSRSDTLGKHLKDVFPEVILEQIDIEAQIRKVFQDNRPLPGQRLSYRAPGVPLRIYYYRVLPYAAGRKVESVLLMMEDVTEQTRLSREVHRVENHLASVINSASDAVVSTDPKGVIVSWNPAAERITGLSLSAVRHRLFFDLCGASSRARVEKLWADIMAGQAPSITEWEMRTTRDDPVTVSWVCSPLHDPGGRPAGVVALGRDLTEQRRLELQLIQSQKLAALGVMAGGIAHQVRNPLAICSSAAQFLEAGDADPDLRRNCAAKIHKSIRKASTIIENLLKFSRPAVGLDKELVDIIGLIRDAVDLARHPAQVHKIHIEARLAQPSIFVNGNADLLQQALVNLLLNAIEAMPDGGRLVIDAAIKHPKVMVRVRDTGCGMASEQLEKIFDPFYTRSRDKKGTGLGLSIAYAIIELHTGEIVAESRPGKGSVFTVTLPRA